MEIRSINQTALTYANKMPLLIYTIAFFLKHWLHPVTFILQVEETTSPSFVINTKKQVVDHAKRKERSDPLEKYPAQTQVT